MFDRSFLPPAFFPPLSTTKPQWCMQENTNGNLSPPAGVKIEMRNRLGAWFMMLGGGCRGIGVMLWMGLIIGRLRLL